MFIKLESAAGRYILNSKYIRDVFIEKTKSGWSATIQMNNADTLTFEELTEIYINELIEKFPDAKNEH